jgi:hypothetical protein
MSFDVPESVIASVTGRPASDVVAIDVCPLGGGTGAATAGMTRLTVRIVDPHHGVEEFTLVRKAFRPLRAGRHKDGTADPRH